MADDRDITAKARTDFADLLDGLSDEQLAALKDKFALASRRMAILPKQSRARLAVLEDDRPIGIPIPVDGLQKSGLLIDEDSLHVQGSSDPWMIVPLPEAHQDRPIRGRFVVHADRLPLWIGDAASSPAARAAISSLPESSRVRLRADEARAQLATLSGAR